MVPEFFKRSSFSISSGHAEANHVAKLFASLLDPLTLAFGHPALLCDQIYEYPNIREHDQHDHPSRLGPAGYVVTTEQVAEDCDHQPEPSRVRF
jgi:hypothetical protein